ncbi:MAG TPA: histidinol-phosphate transaminase, partial [Clostridia bacterium]
MNRFWSKTASDIAPYVPGEQPRDKKYIKLNTNENPYPPSPKVLETIRRETSADVRLYPDP